MKTEIIWTTTENKGKDLWNSPLWKGCYADDEMTDEIRKSKNKWFIYYIKFQGLIPIMISKKKTY